MSEYTLVYFADNILIEDIGETVGDQSATVVAIEFKRDNERRHIDKLKRNKLPSYLQGK